MARIGHIASHFLHQCIGVISENGYYWSFLLFVLAAILLCRHSVSLTIVIASTAAAFALVILGPMIDEQTHHQDHDMLPFEMIFRAIQFSPFAIALFVRMARLQTFRSVL